MTRSNWIRRALAPMVALAVAGSILLVAGPSPADASTCRPTPLVSGPWGSGAAFDGSLGTAYDPPNGTSQTITVDYGCVGTFDGFRRYMTSDSGSPFAWRWYAYEVVRYSTDGVHWTTLRLTDRGYGWTAWHRPAAPVEARYVRYSWAVFNDSLHEMEIDFRRPPSLGLTVGCIGGEVLCTATATNASGDVDFTWRTVRNASGLREISSSATRSTISGVCTGDYTVRVTATDRSGNSVTRTAGGYCGPLR